MNLALEQIGPYYYYYYYTFFVTIVRRTETLLFVERSRSVDPKTSRAEKQVLNTVATTTPQLASSIR